MIASHSCAHPGQDKLHGKGRRVFNERVSNAKGMRNWRCSVCLGEMSTGVKEEEKKE